MPNHVENHIEYSGDARHIRTMLESIKTDKYGIGTVDFNKIIPMPESLNIEAGSKTNRGLKAYKEFIDMYTFGRFAEEAEKALENIPVDSENAFLRQRTDIVKEEWELGKIAWQNIRQYGSPTWYEWSVANWGTKWNAYGYDEYTDYSGCDELTFKTAWSVPHPILKKLSELFPNISFKHQWADEDIGMNCGERSYLGGEITDWFIPEGIQATEFALKIWCYEPPELDLVKNSTGTDYINVENKSYQLIEILGKPALFSNERICPEDIPEGFFCYDLRVSDDGDWFAVAESKVTVNYGGSIITNEPLDLGESGYIPFDEDTEPNFTGEELTIGEFMNSKFEQEQEMGGM